MFRIGHIGYYDVLDITTVLAAVELLLVESGADVERGAAVARALEAYREIPRDRSRAPQPSRPISICSFSPRTSLGPRRSELELGSMSSRIVTRSRRDHRRVRRDRGALGHDSRRGPDRAGGAPQGDRAGGSRRRQRGRRRCDQARNRRRECRRVDRRLGGGARGRASARARAERAAGARGTHLGNLGSRALCGDRACREDTRCARSRPHRSPGRAPGARARNARPRLRPVRRARSLRDLGLEPRRSSRCTPTPM